MEHNEQTGEAMAPSDDAATDIAQPESRSADAATLEQAPVAATSAPSGGVVAQPADDADHDDERADDADDDDADEGDDDEGDRRCSHGRMMTQHSPNCTS